MAPIPGTSKHFGEMDSSSSFGEEASGGGTSRIVRLRHVAKVDRQIFETLVSELGKMGGDLFRGLYGAYQGSPKRYVSDVVVTADMESAQGLHRILHEYGPLHRGRFFFYLSEGNHVHVVHDCPYSNSSCRCSFAKTSEFRRGVRPSLRTRRYLADFDAIDWYNVFIYFFLSKGDLEVCEIWIDGTLQRLSSSNKSLRWKEMCDRLPGSVLEKQSEGTGCNTTSEFPNDEQNRADIRTTTSGLKSKRSKFDSTVAEVSSLLDKYVVIPPETIRDVIAHSPDYSTNLHNPTQEKNYLMACRLYSLKLNRFTLSDFAQFYENKTPIFYANSMDPFEYYHTLEESVQVLNELLLFQLDGHDEKVTEFLYNLRLWFDKEGWNGNPKINALAVIGPPNAGKNFFFDAIAAVACNIGHIGRVNNKTNQFALQDAFQRRLVVGNEISMEDGAKEDFKKLCEGTAFNIRVKYQGDKIFTKTPVLLLSNFMLDICQDNHFRDVRLHTIRWRQAELLVNYKKTVSARAV